jgi:hypothetical protein
MSPPTTQIVDYVIYCYNSYLPGDDDLNLSNFLMLSCFGIKKSSPTLIVPTTFDLTNIESPVITNYPMAYDNNITVDNSYSMRIIMHGDKSTQDTKRILYYFGEFMERNREKWKNQLHFSMSIFNYEANVIQI